MRNIDPLNTETTAATFRIEEVSPKESESMIAPSVRVRLKCCTL